MDTREIERTIIKKYRKSIWSKFVEAIKEYELIKENDVIAVCISGGKDSFLMAKCLQELQRHGQFKFELKFLIMDPGYCEYDKFTINDNALKLGINLSWFDTDIFEVLKKSEDKFPCYMCARMRRGYLYSFAKELGCNKIALGHHFNDVIETIMLNVFYNGAFGGMPAKLHSDNFPGMELIRPMYLIKEEDIKSWAKSCSLEFLACGCSVTKEKYASKRKEIKELILKLKETNKNIDINIFRSSENVNLNTINGYYKDKIYHSFLDEYEK